MTRKGSLAISVQHSRGLRSAPRPVKLKAPNCRYGCATVCQSRTVKPRTTCIFSIVPRLHQQLLERYGNIHHYPDTVAAQKSNFGWSRSVLVKLLSPSHLKSQVRWSGQCRVCIRTACQITIIRNMSRSGRRHPQWPCIVLPSPHNACPRVPYPSSLKLCTAHGPALPDVVVAFASQLQSTT